MKELYELKEKVYDELKDYSKKDLTSGALDIVKDLTKTAYYLCKIIENEEDGGYSNRYMMDYPMNRGYSRAKRDSKGRYSSKGYSYHGNDMEELRELMENAPNEGIRQDLQRIMQKMESM